MPITAEEKIYFVDASPGHISFPSTEKELDRSAKPCYAFPSQSVIILDFATAGSWPPEIIGRLALKALSLRQRKDKVPTLVFWNLPEGRVSELSCMEVMHEHARKFGALLLFADSLSELMAVANGNKDLDTEVAKLLKGEEYKIELGTAENWQNSPLLKARKLKRSIAVQAAYTAADILDREIKWRLREGGGVKKDTHVLLFSGKHARDYVIGSRLLLKSPIRRRLALAIYSRLSSHQIDALLTFSAPGESLAEEIAEVYRERSPSGKNVSVTCTEDYFDPRPIMNKTPDLAGKNVLVVTDVMSMGGIEDRLIELSTRLGAAQTTAVVLVCTNNYNGTYNDQIIRLCRIPTELYEPDKCPLCPDAPLHELDPDTLAPVELSPAGSLTDLLKKETSTLQLWMMVNQAGALIQHAEVNGRHIFMYVDTARMVSTHADYIREFIMPKVPAGALPAEVAIIYAPNVGAELLAQLIASQIPAHPDVLKAVRTGTGSLALFGGAIPADKVKRKYYLVDDGVHTGATLKELSALLRAETNQAPEMIVILLEKLRESAKETLRASIDAPASTKVFSIFNTRIPGYVGQTVHCPLCWEIRYLKEEAGKQPGNLASRYIVRRRKEIEPISVSTEKRDLALNLSPDRAGSDDETAAQGELDSLSDSVQQALLLDCAEHIGHTNLLSIVVQEVLNGGAQERLLRNLFEVFPRACVTRSPVRDSIAQVLKTPGNPTLLESVLRYLMYAGAWHIIEAMPFQEVLGALLHGADRHMEFTAFVLHTCKDRRNDLARQIITEIEAISTSHPSERVKERAKKIIEDWASQHAEIVGRSLAIEKVKEFVEQVAPLPEIVLLTGETGTGKETVARAISKSGPRRNNPFIAVNCAGIPETLFEAEMFGYKKGAFTGAERDHDGYFIQADKGILFLDEIDSITPPMQAKLLRAIEDRKVPILGLEGSKSEELDVRVIAAASSDLFSKMGARDGFRSDLYFRLAVHSIKLPPLKERLEDLEPLLQNLWRENQKDKVKKDLIIHAKALMILKLYPWPGNVRELRNFVKRIALKIGKASTLLAQHLDTDCFDLEICKRLPEEVLSTRSEKKDKVTRLDLFKAYLEHQGNQKEVAEYFDVDPRTIRNWLDQQLKV